jgi:ATP-grasp domain, R2K clade family 2
MPTLILTPRYSEYAQSLWRAATQLAGNMERLLNWRLLDDRIELLQVTVIDIGRIRDRRGAIVEQNAAWGSGLYGCDRDYFYRHIFLLIDL